MKLIKNKKYYLVKWKDFDYHESTWEPYNNIKQCQDILNSFHEEYNKELKLKIENQKSKAKIENLEEKNQIQIINPKSTLEMFNQNYNQFMEKINNNNQSVFKQESFKF